MKLTFHGDTLQEIHYQILEAANTIKGTSVINEAEASDYDTDDAPEAVPESVLKLDGHTVSVGKVWTPVEDRPGSFRGTPIETYQAQPPMSQNNFDLDSKGVPYDANIHTSTKAKTKSGEWKLKPGGASKVEAPRPEVFVPPTPPMSEKAVVIPVAVAPPPVVEVPVYEESSAPIGMAPPIYDYPTFKTQLPMLVVKLMGAKKIERSYVTDLANYFGVSNLWDVAKDDTKCKDLYNSFCEFGFITGV